MKTLLFSLLILSLSVVTLKAQDLALKQLEKSPRHQEWIKIPSGDREVTCFVVYPEISTKTTVAIVIHENRGMSDWVRSFTDQLAGEGYIAIAPDLLSDFNEDIETTADFENSDDARNAIYQLAPDQIKQDLNAIEDFASGIPAGNGKTVSIGFCWGGSQSFRFATYNDNLEAALVFYGSAPDEESIKEIDIPVYGFYGGSDNRINAGIPETEKLMKEAGIEYKHEIYPGAGHGYMRQGDAPDATEANKEARNKSWVRMLKILQGL